MTLLFSNFSYSDKLKGDLVTNTRKPFHDGGRYHIETSPLICGADQWIGFYMITASVIKGLNASIDFISSSKEFDDCNGTRTHNHLVRA